jgi:hypothetical protein
MRTLLITLSIFVVSLSISAAEPIKELSPLSPFIGTWQTVGGSVDGSDDFEDISRWEWAFDGKIVKITHSVNQGAYYGESLIGWDAQKSEIVYRYVNNAGFFTDGVITPVSDARISVHEVVRGSTSGPTETLSEYWIDEAGLLKAWSKLKIDGKWTEQNDVSYARNHDVAPKMGK